jgi:predicted transcriptional regulator
MRSSTVIKCFGASAWKLRCGLGISQEKLAERADLRRTYIADIAQGARNPALLTIRKLVGNFSRGFVVRNQMSSLKKGMQL